MERLVSWLLCLLVLVAGVLPAAAAPSVTASIEPRTFSVDEAATLHLTIHDGSGSVEQLPEVAGLQFQQRGQSSQHQWINGSLSSSKTFLVQVTADRPGTYTIPPIALAVDGKRFTTEPLTVEVTAAAPAPPPSVSSPQPLIGQGGNASELPAFLRVSAVKEQSYVGEVMPVEIKAYFRRGIRASLNSRPQLNGDGFVLNLAGQEPTQTEEVVDGVPYAVLSWPATLSAIRKGEHAVSVGVEATMLVPDASQRRRGLTGDPLFDNDLFADFFNQHSMQEKKINLVSTEQKLQAQALPEEGRPADFNGAIGRFELDVTAHPAEVQSGEPITLTMTVRGTGNVEQLNAPVLSDTEGWKTYSPSAKYAPGASPGEGSKVFEQVVIAKGGGAAAIPPLVLSFFDPQSKSYQSLRSNPIPLRQAKGAEGSESTGQPEAQKTMEPQAPQSSAGEPGKAASGPPVEPKSPPPAGSLALRTDMGSLRPAQVSLLTRPWLYIGVLLMFLILVFATLWQLRALRLASDSVALRRREQERLLDLRLSEMRAAAGRGDSSAFFSLCRRCMQEQLGLRWQIAAEAITLADLRQRLPTGSPLIEIFALAEGSMYGSGAGVTSAGMTSYAGVVETELRGVQC